HLGRNPLLVARWTGKPAVHHGVGLAEQRLEQPSACQHAVDVEADHPARIHGKSRIAPLSDQWDPGKRGHHREDGPPHPNFSTIRRTVLTFRTVIGCPITFSIRLASFGSLSFSVRSQ